MKYKVLAFDFDGVMNNYAGNYKGDAHTDPPNGEVLEAIRILKKQGYKIIIFSTRSTATLKKFCKEHAVPVDYYNENPEMSVGNPGKPKIRYGKKSITHTCGQRYSVPCFSIIYTTFTMCRLRHTNA